jgi:prophage regulatory protein
MISHSRSPVPCVQILRLPQVCKVTGLGRSMIYQLESERRFPCRVRIGARAVGWVDAEVQSWLAGRIENHRAGERCEAAPAVTPGESAGEGTGSSRPRKALNRQLVDSQLFLFAANRNSGQPVK